MNLNNTYLKQRCKAVSKTDGVNIPYIVSNMFRVLNNSGGVGLAANQVGLPHKIICVKYGDFSAAVVNPTIEKKWGGMETKPEGCLSFPGVQVDVSRHKKIVVSGFDENWNPVVYKPSGMVARIFQHECDHLDGICIVT